MANPTVRSVASNTATSGTSVTVAKPAGLTAGDFMVAFVGFKNVGVNRYHATPAGWTEQASAIIDTDNRGIKCYVKTADAGDVAASNFTFSFTGGTVDKMVGAIYAITGAVSGSEITLFETDTSFTTGTKTVTYTTAITPVATETLVVSGWLMTHNSLAATLTTSSYTLAPTTTMTEDVDTGIRDGLGDGISLFCHTAEYDGTTEITSRALEVSETLDGDGSGSIFLLINAPSPASGTHTLLTTTTEVFGGSGRASASGTNTLLTTSTSLFTQTGYGRAPAGGWTNNNRPTLAQTQLNAVYMDGNNKVYMSGENKVYRDASSRNWVNETRP